METDDVVIVTNGGKIIRQHASDIRVAGRNTQGVRLIRLEAKDLVSDVSAVPSEEDQAVEAQAVLAERAPKASGPQLRAEVPPQATPAKPDARIGEKRRTRERQPAQPARKSAGKRKGKRR